LNKGHFPLGVQAPKVTDLVANTPVSQMQNMLNPDQTKRFAMATKNNPNMRPLNQNLMNLKQDKKLYVGNIPFGITEVSFLIIYFCFLLHNLTNNLYIYMYNLYIKIVLLYYFIIIERIDWFL